MRRGLSFRTVRAYAALKAGGVHVEWAFPGVLWHQKSIVADSKRVMIMTANLDAQYYPIIRGFLVTTDNPATVSGIVSTFNTDFTHTTSAPKLGVIPSGSELIWAPGAQSPLVATIGTAKPGTTLITENEQFTSPIIAQALVAAAKRGVTVDVVRHLQRLVRTDVQHIGSRRGQGPHLRPERPAVHPVQGHDRQQQHPVRRQRQLCAVQYER